MIGLGGVERYTQVTALVDALDVPYVIGGSLASIAHDMVHATMDPDIIAELQPHHAAVLLVVDWLAQRSTLAQRPALTSPGLTAAWVSLDENDFDPDSFLRYLTTTVHNTFSPARPCAST